MVARLVLGLEMTIAFVVKKANTIATITIVEDPTLDLNTIILRDEQYDHVVNLESSVVTKRKRTRFEPQDLNDPHCDVMTWRSFVDDVRTLALTNHDGHGDLATEFKCSNHSITPNMVWEDLGLTGKPDDWYPEPPYTWVTHVVWYNK